MRDACDAILEKQLLIARWIDRAQEELDGNPEAAAWNTQEEVLDPNDVEVLGKPGEELEGGDLSMPESNRVDDESDDEAV